jgi:hypothetical protein
LKILFLTFGDGTLGFSRAAERLVRQFTQAFPEHTAISADSKVLYKLNPEYWAAKQDFVKQNPRGFGNWIWKPALVNHAFLGEFGEFDLLFYLDAGCELNFSSEAAILRFREYCKMAMEKGGLAFAHKQGQFGINDFSESRWTKPSLLSHLNPDPPILRSPQLQAGCFFMARRSSKLAFDWFKISNIDDSIYLRDETLLGQYVHRNDQSIFSILWKESKFETIEDETFFDFKKDLRALNFPIWTARNSTSRETLDDSFFGMIIRRGEVLISKTQIYLTKWRNRNC